MSSLEMSHAVLTCGIRARAASISSVPVTSTRENAKTQQSTSVVVIGRTR